MQLVFRENLNLTALSYIVKRFKCELLLDYRRPIQIVTEMIRQDRLKSE